MKIFQPIKNLLNENNIFCTPEQRKINTLENELSALKDIVKDDLYKAFIKNFGTTEEVTRLRKENAKYRRQKKEYKKELQELKGGSKNG